MAWKYKSSEYNVFIGLIYIFRREYWIFLISYYFTVYFSVKIICFLTIFHKYFLVLQSKFQFHKRKEPQISLKPFNLSY